jgi:outer membrane protein assembly factor BamB
MLYRWRNLFVMLVAAVLFVAGCKKQFSSDNPLPTSYYPSIILSSDNKVVYAVDPGTGKKNWEFSMPVGLTNPSIYFAPSPLVYNNMVYMGAYNSDTIYKINGKTGALVKKMIIYPYAYFTLQSTPIADGKLLYISTTNDTLYAIDTGTGNVAWKFASSWDQTPFVASPVIYQNNIYVASTGGHVYCIDKLNGPDATTGLPIWDYPGYDSVATGSFVSSPTISAPYLYVGSKNDSNMYCIYLNPAPPPTPVDPTPGQLRWRFKTLGNITSSPTSYAGICLFGCSDFRLYCVDTQTGTAKWTFATSSQISSSPIISNQVVYVGSYDYNLYAVNLINGKKKWNFATKGLIKSSPLPYNGSVYVGSYDGYLYSVDSAFGTLKWSFKINGNIECSPAIDDYSNKQYNSGISGYNTSGNNN